MTDKTFRDSSGKALADYPQPSVAVDAALLTPDPEHGLLVLQVKRANTSGWGLPGTFLHRRERLTDAVRRCLRDKAGVRGVDPHQWRVGSRQRIEDHRCCRRAHNYEQHRARRPRPSPLFMLSCPSHTEDPE